MRINDCFKNKIVIAGIMIGVASSVVTILGVHSVDNKISMEDSTYIPKYLTGISKLKNMHSYEEEIDFITAVQASVLKIAPGFNRIPLNQKREPKELFYSKSGLCFDRSRVIEKILRYSGFKTRHISMFSTVASGSGIKAFISKETSSHAITEVFTKKGWLVIDSNAPWISLSDKGLPVSMKTIQENSKGKNKFTWAEEPPTSIYNDPFVFLYGFYSRHGRFYPPYDPIPDIHYGEFIQNVIRSQL